MALLARRRVPETKMQQTDYLVPLFVLPQAILRIWTHLNDYKWHVVLILGVSACVLARNWLYTTPFAVVRGWPETTHVSTVSRVHVPQRRCSDGILCIRAILSADALRCVQNITCVQDC
eukprot:723694-Pleurochrysis_carterae.AAC.2